MCQEQSENLKTQARLNRKTLRFVHSGRQPPFTSSAITLYATPGGCSSLVPAKGTNRSGKEAPRLYTRPLNVGTLGRREKTRLARHEHPHPLDHDKLLDIGLYWGRLWLVSYGAKKTIFTSAQGTSDEHRNP